LSLRVRFNDGIECLDKTTTASNREGVLSRPFAPRSSYSPPNRINGKIRSREVRVIGPSGQQLGVLPLGDAINLARSQGVDLVEIAPNAQPPVCKLVDYGKFKYEQAKKEKGQQKPANKVKEIQLRPSIDPHDFGVKLGHAIDFLCEDMKVKVALRFRGREMAHKEFGFQVVNKFIEDLAPYAHADSEPKLQGRGITVMLTPLPRNKRAKNPREAQPAPGGTAAGKPASTTQHSRLINPLTETEDAAASPSVPTPGPLGFVNNPFSQIDLSDRS
jgi:translation initiation factor IF-3